MARFVLGAAPITVAECWNVSERFAQVRAELSERVHKSPHTSRSPEGAVIASVARGLFALGQSDEGVVLAALAIEAGRSADENGFGASALSVLLDPRLARAPLFDRLRTRLDDHKKDGG